MNNSNNNYDELIHEAGQKSGIDPQNIKNAMNNGKVDDIISKLKPADAARFREILNNPDLARQMLNTPQAQMLIRKFMK